MFKAAVVLIITFLLFSTFITTGFAQDWEWAFGIKGSDFDYSSAIATDVDGNIYIAGYFSSPNISFNSLTFQNKGGEDIFIAKFDNSGNVIWVKTFGGEGNDRAIAIVVDKDNNLVLTGSFESPALAFMSFGLINRGGGDLFICKFTSDGDVIWAKSYGGSSYEEPTTIATDLHGNIIIGGEFSGDSFIIGSDTLKNSAIGYNGISDIFIAKLSSSGESIWARSAGGVSFEQAHSLATDRDSNIVVVGAFNSNKIGFGNDTLVNIGYSDIFVTKYDSKGNVLWAKGGYGEDKDWANTVTIDNNGNIYVAGEFLSEEFKLANYTISNKGSYDILLAKFDKDGNLLWANSFGEDIDDYGKSLVYSNGYVYLGGYFASKTLAFGNAVVTNRSQKLTSDIYIAKFDDSGNCIWVKSAGGDDEDQSFDIAIDKDGNAFQTGNFESKYIYFNKESLYNYGYSNVFVSKLNPKLSDIYFALQPTKERISIAPNPSDNFISIRGEFFDLDELKIFNLFGECVYSQSVTGSEIIIDVRSLSRGIYLLCISGNSTFFFKN
jgi:hypothetical protein